MAARATSPVSHAANADVPVEVEEHDIGTPTTNVAAASVGSPGAAEAVRQLFGDRPSPSPPGIAVSVLFLLSVPHAVPTITRTSSPASCK